MKAASQALKDWLASGPNVVWRADLLILTTRDGSVYRWTTADVSLVYAGSTYYSAGSQAPLVQRGRLRQGAGLTVDTLDLTLSAKDSFLIGGKKLGVLAVQGFFDGAQVRVDHLLMPSPGDTSLGPIEKWFVGRVATAEAIGDSIVLRVKSDLERFNVMLPRFFLQAPCGNLPYDAGCGLSRAIWTITGCAVATGSTTTVLRSTHASLVDKASGYFQLGVLTITSGSLAGTRRAVSASSVSAGVASITLAQPLSTAPAVGDQFDIYPGCDRSRDMCVARFNNLSRFRGFPHVPRAEAGNR